MKFTKIVCFTVAALIFLCGQAFCNDTGLTITSSGYTGIGTGIPENKLHIHNTEATEYLMRISSTCQWGTRLLFQSSYNNNTTDFQGFSMSTGGTHQNLKDSLYFSTMGNDTGDLGVPLLTLKNSGNVGIGTNGPAPSSNYKLYVNGYIHTTEQLVENSDERLKKNIKTIDKAIDKLATLRGVSYEWNDLAQEKAREGLSVDKKINKTNPLDDRVHLGLLAQDVEKVFPEAVHTDSTGMKGIAYSQLIGPMIESLKELKQENDDLKARLSKIEAVLDQKIR